MHESVKVTSDNEILLPEYICEKLGIHIGDEVYYKTTESGLIITKSKQSECNTAEVLAGFRIKPGEWGFACMQFLATNRNARLTFVLGRNYLDLILDFDLGFLHEAHEVRMGRTS